MAERSLPNFRAMLDALDDRLVAALQESRATFAHSSLKGDGAEGALRNVLSDNLPPYLAVGTGEVIDLSDTRSGQVDVVIANEDNPFRKGTHEPGLFLLEGVAAAGEVKSCLTTAELSKAVDGAARFRRLRCDDMDGQFMVAVAPGSDRFRYQQSRPYFLFAFESRIAPATLTKRLTNAAPVTGPDGTGTPIPAIDAVFILGQGAAINYGDGQGVFRYQHDDGPQAGDFADGWLWHASDSRVASYFLLWLNAVMPRSQRLNSVATNYLYRAFQE